MNAAALHERTFAEYEAADLRDWPVYEAWLEYQLDLARREAKAWLEELQAAKSGGVE